MRVKQTFMFRRMRIPYTPFKTNMTELHCVPDSGGEIC